MKPQAIEQLTLREPSEALADDFLAMAAEFRQEGDERFAEALDAAAAGFASYVRRLEHAAQGIGIEPCHVPWSTYWLLRDGRRVLGTARLRHRLNESLRNAGGHIGYDIRPSERRKGYGNAILAMVLPRARELGLRRVLLTCAADNVASARIIERNGGVLESRGRLPDGRELLRYWIDL